MLINDEDLLRQFESCTLPGDVLNHVNHLRIAWLYLHRHELGEAIDKVSRGTRKFTEVLGATGKYHQTITEASVRLMHNRIEQSKPASFDDFLAENEDMVLNLKALLSCYYTQECLRSSAARLNFIEPDIQDFD